MARSFSEIAVSSMAKRRAAIQKYPMVPANKAILSELRQAPGWNTVRPPLRPLADEAKKALFTALAGVGFTLDRPAAAA